jgi:hypothetical protein
MSTLTTRLNATKPASSENVSITTLNNNFDLFDAAVGSSVGTSAARPASAFSGRLWYSTDSAKLVVNTAASASTAASWADPVANGLAAIGNLSITGALTVGNGVTVTAGKGYKTYVRKSAAESLASNATLQNDDHLTFSLAASSVYVLDVVIHVSGPAAGDFKTQWAFTGAASAGNHANRFAVGPATTATDVTAAAAVRMSSHAWGASATYGTDGTNTSIIREGGLLDTTAGGSGTITLQWAQNTSNATSTVVSTSSYAILERLA